MKKSVAVTSAAAVLLLAACGSKSENSYSVDDKTGDSNATITTDDGTVSMQSGANVPVKLPRGFKLYPGAKVVSNTTIQQESGSGALVIMESGDTPQEMADYYRAQAESAGIEVKLQLSTDAGRMIAGESKDGVAFSFNANRGEGSDAGKTSAQLMIGSKPGG
ncbi:MAG: hypothetical protein IE933_03960 [Sphingomonadales bacterium]|nr:hypothetical protein [Sphingomonadales bacterium]MBD3772551.1 hypothetical protein [Paracoccaceae bacterium]